MDKLHLEIVTPEGQIFSNEVKSVQLPGSEGELGILPGHASIITLLNPGVIEIVNLNNNHEMVAINWGYLKVDETKATVLADGAVYVGGDSESAIAASLQKAKELISSMGSETSAYAATLARIDDHARHN